MSSGTVVRCVLGLSTAFAVVTAQVPCEAAWQSASVEQIAATERSTHVSSTHLLQRIAAGGGEIANTPCTIERLRAGIFTSVQLEAERQLEMRSSTKTTCDGFDRPARRS